MKKLIRCIMIALLLPIAFVCGGCGIGAKDAISIKDIKKTDSVGVVDTYTVTYTNGDTSQFTIVNGKDGENIYTNVTINDLYEQVKTSKPEGYTLIDFIAEYLDIELDSSAIASANALRSAVSIFVEHEVTIPDYNNPISYSPYEGYIYGVKNSISLGAGAGVIYDLDKDAGDAYIITNYHVCYSGSSLADDGIATKFITYIYGSETFDTNVPTCLKYYNYNCKDYKYLFEEYDENGLPVIDYGFGAVEAEYVGGSEQYDIAVLKISNSEVIKNSDCLEAQVYDSDMVTAGSTAIAVGNPDGCGIAVTNGVISVDNEYISVEVADEAISIREFRIDTPVNPGNSGGGLFDAFGRLIGIVNAKTTDTSIENMSYAIPGNIATRIAQSVIDNCDGVDRKTTRVLVGMTIEIVGSKGYYDDATGLMRINETVAVSKIEAGSLATEMGLKVGDVINSVEIVKSSETIEIQATRLFRVIDVMLLVREGDSIVINYTRNGETGVAATPVLTADNFIDIE